MADIRSYIKSNILEPLKSSPTIIQDTMLEIMTDRLVELYEYSWRFPEILSPNQNRLDILKAIADQFLFTIREEADIQEQVDILDNILYVYNRRGSIDTIENMWKYYGGDLPKDVQVVIPSYDLFRYSISALSGTHKFLKGKDTSSDSGRVDRTVNSPGVYEIRLINNTYPIPDLREFLLSELVAAGNEIFFTNDVHLDILSKDASVNPYYYKVMNESLVEIQLEAMNQVQGLTFSGYNNHYLDDRGNNSAWSGGENIYLSLLFLLDLSLVKLNTYLIHDLELQTSTSNNIRYSIKILEKSYISSERYLYCTPSTSAIFIARNLYDEQGEIINPGNSLYPGYFILGESLLGEEVI